MIFASVGHQMPFDRLIRRLDSWASRHRDTQVFAQIGETDFRPQWIEWVRVLSPADFRERMSEAELVVAHAGTGVILMALELGTPIVVMPRKAALRETRNDHQLATAQRFGETGRVTVVDESEAFDVALDKCKGLKVQSRISPHASPELIAAVRRAVMLKGGVAHCSPASES